MNILVLHGLGQDLNLARGTSVAHLQSFQRHAPEHRYLYQDVGWPVTQQLREFPFDVVLVDGTFLCWRWVRPRELLTELQEQYAWLAQHPAVKIAFPQDDYDHAHLLDRWLAAWKVDHVYTVCPKHHDVLYPQLSRQPGRLSVALTGYVDGALASQQRRSIASRRVLVGYRARELPPWFGSLGNAKSRLGGVFALHAARRGLAVDVSTDPKDVLIGEAWTRFLSDSRFTLGCESGSSLLDAEGELRERAEAYLRRHPGASSEQVLAQVFPGEDGRHVFSAVSPRVFEAAALGSCQVLLEGEYLPEIRPGEHYIEIRRDWSNIEDVLDQLRDTDRAQAMADACHEAIIRPATYHYSTRVREVFERIAGLRTSSAELAPPAAFDAMAHDHEVASRALHAAMQRIEALRRENAVLRRKLTVPLTQRIRARVLRLCGFGQAL